MKNPKDPNPNPFPFRRATVYPPDAIAANPGLDVIDPAEVRTLPGLFRERVARSPDEIAYIQYQHPHPHPHRSEISEIDGGGEWVRYSWRQMAAEVERWRRALVADGAGGAAVAGARAAIRMGNRREWVVWDQACLACNLVLTPLYAEDRPDSIAYILEQTEARFLCVETAAMWLEMAEELPRLGALTRVVALEDPGNDLATIDDPRVMSLARWLESAESAESAATADKPAPPPAQPAQPDDLATIVYTSGTTGKPKGVMLSHANILRCAHAGLKSVAVFPADRFLSFLPLSHMFERTVGYCLPMMAGAAVAVNRSIPELADDLAVHRPTVLITVPRIFERAYHAILARLAGGPAVARWLFECAVEAGWRRFEIAQGRRSGRGWSGRWHWTQLLWPLLDALVARKIRRRFGGNLRFVISGGAPLAPKISRVFIALGIEVLQGYGLTESGPTLTVNTLAKNNPSSIGLPLIGAEIRLAESGGSDASEGDGNESGELQARSPGVMLGYWRDEAATRACIDGDGWLATGDLAAIDADGFITITGRLKEIIVLANGEKAPPADMEAAICDHPLFEQAMVLGEGRPFLCALIVLNRKTWQRHAEQLGLDADDDAALATEPARNFVLDTVAGQLRGFPGYAAVRRVWITGEPWTVADGVLTPTLKIKRPALRERFQAQIEKMYEGHR